MEEVKFKSLFRFLKKTNLNASAAEEDGKFAFFTSSNIVNKRTNHPVYNQESLVIGNGGSANIHYINTPFSATSHCYIAVKKEYVFNLKYVYYFLYSNIHILERGFKGAGLKNISAKYIEEIKVPLPDLETQNKIVAILDKVQSIINKREEIIQKHDEFLRATFLNMFGIKNSQFQHWKDISIGELGKEPKKSFRTGPFGSSLKHERFQEEGEVAVLGIDNAVDNIFKWKKRRFLSIEEFGEFSRYQVFPRDVIITIMGTVGRSAVIPKNIGLAINTKHLAAITLDEKKCNPYYLAYSIHSNPYIRYQLKTRARGAIMEGFNLTLIKDLKLKDAPIDMQNKFEQIYVKYTQNIKKLALSKNKLQDLFNALSQLAFKGELEFGQGVDLEVLLDNDYAFFKDNSNQKSIQQLLERIDKNELNENKFYDSDVYDKAKNFIFELLKEDKIEQIFDKEINTVKLKLK